MCSRFIIIELQERQNIQLKDYQKMYSIESNAPLKYMKGYNTQDQSFGTFSTNATMKTKKVKSKKNQPEITIIPYLDKYKKNDKLSISQIDRQKVEKNNFTKREAQRKFKVRQALGDLYLKYNFNPFMALQQKDQKVEKRTQLKARNTQVLDIIDTVNPKKQNNPNNLREQMQKIFKYRKQRLEFTLKSKKILQQTLRSQTLREKSQQKSYRHEQGQKELQKSNILPIRQKEDEQLDIFQSDIDQIVNQKQPNFFMQQSKKLNIFKILSEDTDISPISQLEKYNFCFNSIVEMNYKLRIPFLRDLSTMARSTIGGTYKGKQNIIDHVFSHQMTLNLKQLRFIDIINVASNRFSSQFLYKKFYSEQRQDRNQFSDDYSEETDEQHVQYRDIEHNFQVLFNGGTDVEVQQIEAYKRNFTQAQTHFAKDMEQNIVQFLKISQNKKRLHQTAIRDLKVHQIIDQDMKETMKRLVFSDKQQQKSLQKTVRLRKMYCDRAESIRLDNFKKIMKENQKIKQIQRNFGQRHLKTENLLR